jgi:hypothetical protein
MGGNRFDSFTFARHDARPSPGSSTANVLRRAEVLRVLRREQRRWASILATHVPGTPCLASSADRAGFNSALDLLQEAGANVPSGLYQRGLPVRTLDAASGTAASERLPDLLADVTRVLAWCDLEPSDWVQGVSSARPRPGAGAEPRIHGELACASTNVGSPAAGVRTIQGAGTAGCARGVGRSRQGGPGGGRVSWNPTDEDYEAAAGEWSVGDRVTARANALTARAGSRGTVVGFSGAGGHPLVDFDGSGRVLIRADQLGHDGDSPIEATSA